MSGEGFLDRWSRLKRQPEPPETPVAPEAEGAPEKTDEELLEELGLPDPDSLAAGDDFSAFMAGAVPVRLRNRALRKLWLSNPVLANLDEMVDYGEDFTDAATVIENMKTAYDSARGWLRDEEEAEAEAPDAPEVAPPEPAGPPAAVETAAAPQEPPAPAENVLPPDSAPRSPRRMRFDVTRA